MLLNYLLLRFQNFPKVVPDMKQQCETYRDITVTVTDSENHSANIERVKVLINHNKVNFLRIFKCIIINRIYKITQLFFLSDMTLKNI